MIRSWLRACVFGLVWVAIGSGARSVAAGEPASYAFQAGEVILKFKPYASPQQRDAVRAELGVTEVKALPSIGAERVKIRGTVPDAVARYKDNPSIQFIEPNYIYRVNSTPNDSLFSSLWAMRNQGQTGGTPGADIDATLAWNVTTGSSSILVADIDTGMDYTHPDLAANAFVNPGEIPGNNIDDDGNGFIDDVHGWDFANFDNDPMDDNGHGTHTAGTIGAVGNNGIGVTGVNWNVRILPVKFLSGGGSGTLDAAVQAIDYARRMGVRAMNNSWGGPFSQALQDAVQAASDAGIVFIASAGNAASDTDVFPTYPAGFPAATVISVAATDHNDQLAFFSNYGATSVDLGAPGVSILSTFPGGYAYLDGTSMAAPHVTGAIALIMSVYPSISAVDAKALLLATVDHIPALAGKCVTGGRLNLFTPIAVPDSIAPGRISNLAVQSTQGQSAHLTWTATGDDSATGRATRYELRYSTTTITAGSFGSATLVPGTPDPGFPGATEGVDVGGLAFSTKYFFAIKAFDELGNAGAISNVPSGTTLGPPDIGVSPGSLSASLFTGETADRVLTISNTGVSELNFSIVTRPATGAAMTASTSAASTRVSRSLRVAALPRRTDDPPPLPGSSQPYSEGFVSTRARIVPPTHPSAGPGSGMRIVIVQSGADVSEIAPLLAAFPDVATVDNLDALSGTPSLATLIGYDAAIVVVNRSPLDPVALGNVLADYADSGGGVVLTLASFISGFAVQGRLLSGGYMPFQLGSGPIGSASLGLWDHGHPIMAGVTAAAGALLGAVNLAPGATQVAGWNNGQPFIAVNDYNVVGANVFIGGVGTWTGDVPLILHNAASFSAHSTGWVQHDPSEGTIPVGGSIAIAVRFDASGLDGGDYAAVLDVHSNDPDESDVLVPASLHVTGAPNIVVRGELVETTSFQDYSFSGASTQHTLAPAVPPPGDADLVVRIDGDYGDPSEFVTVSAEGNLIGTVGPTGTDCTSQTRTFVLPAALLSTLLADGHIDVLAQNSFDVDAFCVTNRHTITLRYRLPANPLDFGTLFVGGTRAIGIEIVNDGTDALIVSALSSNQPQFVPDVPALAVPPHQSVTVPVRFTPNSVASFSGTLRIASNDSDTPEILISMQGAGIPPPDIAVSPTSLSASLVTGGTTSQTLTISNPGLSDLIWSLDLDFDAPILVAAATPPMHAPEIDGRAAPATGSKTVASRPPATPPADHLYTERAPAGGSRAETDPNSILPVPSRLDAALEDVLASLDANHDDVTQLIPSRFDFGEGVIGSSIVDGGSDMFDGGNYLGTNFGLPIDYSDGVITASPLLGVNGRYFTRKFPGLFVFAADLDEVSDFTVAGDLGADGAGAVDGLTLDATAAGVHYRGFVKRVFGSGDPSVNHLIITVDAPFATHDFSFFSNDDYDHVGGLLGSRRIYHLLYAANNGLRIDDSSTVRIMNAFLTHVVPGLGWLAVHPSSGTVAPGSHVDLAADFSARSLYGGDYSARVRIHSNDPDEGEVVVPVALHVTGTPDLRIVSTPIELQSVLEYTVSGARTLHTIRTELPPAAGGELEVLADGDYGDFGEFADVTADGVHLGTLGQTGMDCTQARVVFPISAGTLQSMLADGFFQVEVQNSPQVDAFCLTNRHTVTLRYSVGADPIQFGNLFIGLTRTLDVRIMNSGTDRLAIGAITSNEAAFAPDSGGFNLAPTETRDIAIRFTPSSPRAYTGVISIASNDPDTPVAHVNVAGAGIEPPVIDTDPDSIALTLNEGQSADRTLRVLNTGHSILGYNVSIHPRGAGLVVSPFAGFHAPVASATNNAAARPLSGGPPEGPQSAREPSYRTASATFETLASSPANLTCVVEDAAAGIIYAQQNQGTAFYRYRQATNTWESLASCPIYSGNNGGAALLNGNIYTTYTEQSTIMGVYNIASNTWSTRSNPTGIGTGDIASDGNHLLYLLTFNNFVSLDPVTNVMQSFPTPPFAPEPWGGLEVWNGFVYAHQGNGTRGFARFDLSAGAWSTLPILPDGAVLGSAIDETRNEYVCYGNYGGSNLYRFSIDQNAWTVSTIPFFQVGDGGLCWLPAPVPATYMVQGEFGIGFVREIETPEFLQVDPLAGTVPAGGSATLQVHFESLGLLGGRYGASIDITSNDPVRPLVHVPAELTVIGVPNIVVSGAETLLESSRDWFTDGAVTNHSFTVDGHPASGSINVTVNGDYALPGEFAIVTAEGNVLGTLGEIGFDCAPATRTFDLETSLFHTLIADGRIDVRVENTFDVNAFCSINRHTVQLRTRLSGDSLDFGAFFLGGSRTLSLRVSNPGSQALVVGPVTTGRATFVPETTAFQIPPRGSRTFAVRFTPSAAGPDNGTLRFPSNDPDQPVVTVALHGVGLVPPAASVTPGSLSVKLLRNEQTTRTLTIQNTGGSDLDWTAVPLLGAPVPLVARAVTAVESARPLDGAASVAAPGTRPGGAELASILARYDDFRRSGATHASVASSPPRALARPRGPSAMTDSTVLFSDDFEHGPNGWTHYSTHFNLIDQWSMATNRSSSPSTSWRVSQHDFYGSDALQSPPIDLTHVADATLSFRHFYDFDDCNGDPTFEPDGGIVEVSTDNGATWQQITPQGGYPYVLDDICSNPLAFRPAYSHSLMDSSAFVPAVFDLSAFVGQTIRIRFQAGWDCGNCGFNEGWYIDDVSVYTHRPTWIDVSPSSGTIPAGSSATVAVTFDATGLDLGGYDATVRVRSNDPVHGELAVPAHLQVVSQPRIQAPDSIDFGPVFVGSTANRPAVVRNTGDQTLHVTGIASTLVDYSMTPSAFVLAPGESLGITVRFQPAVAGARNGALTFIDDDPDSERIVCRGVGVAPPIVGVSPLSLDVTTVPGHTRTRTLHLCNTGGGPLLFSIHPSAALEQAVEAAAAASGAPDGGLGGVGKRAATLEPNGASGEGGDGPVTVESAPAWLAVSPDSGAVAGGTCSDLTVTLGLGTLAIGNYDAALDLACNDPVHPTQRIDVHLHVVAALQATLDIDPNSLNGASHGRWITAYIEVAPRNPATIVISSLRLNGVVPADPSTHTVGDIDHDGIPDLMVKFSRTESFQTFPESDNVTVAVKGDFTDDGGFESTDPISIVRPHLASPNGGEVVPPGSLYTVSWTIPSGWHSDHSVLELTTDGGASWSTVGSNLSGTSTSWRAPANAAPAARLRVSVWDADVLLGFDSSDQTFAIHAMPAAAETATPLSFALKASVPNPFRSQVALGFDVPRATTVKIAIHDPAGRLVRVLVDGDQPPGSHVARWDGRDARGRIAPPGVYLARMEAGDYHASRTLTLIP